MIPIIYSTLLAAIILFEILRTKKNRWDFLTIFNIVFAAYYPISALFFHLDGSYFFRQIELGRFAPDFSIAVPILVSFAYTALVGTYLATRKFFEKRRFQISPRNSLGGLNQLHYMFIATSGLLLIFLVYAYSYGGITHLFSIATDLRLGKAEKNLYTAWLARFLPMALFPFIYAAVSLFNRQTINTRLSNVVLLTFTSIVYLITAFSHGGRYKVIIGAALFFFAINLHRNQRKIFLSISLIAISVTVLLFGNVLFHSYSDLRYGWDAFADSLRESYSSYSGGSIKDYILTFMHYFQHRIYSINVAYAYIQLNPSYQNYFLEFPNAFLSLIPTFLTGIPPQPGTIQMNNNVVWMFRTQDSSAPPGWIASGYYSLKTLGVLFYAILYGIIGGSLDSIFVRFIRSGPILVSAYVVLGFWWGESIQIGDPVKWLRDTFMLLFLTFFSIVLFYRFHIVQAPLRNRMTVKYK